MQQRSIETKRKILSACVQLFLEQGYKETTVTQIIEHAGVARGSYQNLFPAKEDVLLELVGTMFNGQFDMAGKLTEQNLPPVYLYAVETAIQLTLAELNENLRKLYIEAYTLPHTSEYIFEHTTEKLSMIFGSYLPDYSQSDFYEIEIGTSGIMRNYMVKKCDIHFSLEAKLRRFLLASLRVCTVPENEIEEVLVFIQGIDIKAAATQVMHELFSMLEMKYNFKLSENALAKEEA